MAKEAQDQAGPGVHRFWLLTIAAAAIAAIVVLLTGPTGNRHGPAEGTDLPGSRASTSQPGTLSSDGGGAEFAAETPDAESRPPAVFADGFDAPPISSERWVATRDGDFREAVADVRDGRLRLRVGTIGTRDDTVKHLGLRSREAVVDLAADPDVAVQIDWNKQANGCYLQASVFLCPTRTDGTAAAEPNWLKFEYVGVPPGKNARAAFSRRTEGNLKLPFTEGWPREQRTGRPIGVQNVVLQFRGDTVTIVENGKAIWGPSPHGATFRRAWLYLEVCSHSNYPPREIYFDNVAVRPTRRIGGRP